MRTTTKKLENAVTQIKVTFDKKEWAEAQDAALKRLATRVKLDGFRPGKAPVAMIKARLGKQAIYDEATDQILQKRYADIMKKAEVAPIAQPTLNIDSVDNDNLKITILCPVKPEVELGEYKGLEVKKGRVTVAKKDIEAQVENYRHQFAELTTKENGEVAKGDTVVMDFEGFIDGEAFEGGKAEGYELEIGSNTFIPGFEDQIVGMKTGEEKDVKVKFPDEYFSKDLAGKDATFKVKVNEIKKKELPELDDEFAKDVSEFDTLKELKASIKEKLEKENEERTKYETQDAAVKAVCDNTEIDIPSGMIDSEIDNMVNDMKSRLQYQGLTLDNYLKMIGKTEQEFRKDYEEQAKEAVKSRLLIEAIVKAEKIEADDKDVNAKIEEMAKNYGREAKDLEENEALKNYIKGSLETEKAIEFVVKNAKIK